MALRPRDVYETSRKFLRFLIYELNKNRVSFLRTDARGYQIYCNYKMRILDIVLNRLEIYRYSV